jgi:beta-mannosidase
VTEDAGSASRREFLRHVGVATGALATAAVSGVTGASPGAARSPGWICSVSGETWRSFEPSAQGPVPEVHKTLSLDGNWEVRALPLAAAGETGYRTYLNGAGERLVAQVPGEIHLDLMRAGKMDDPNVGDNARARCRWPERHSWWYRTSFTPPAGLRQAPRQQLVFEGIDLYGQVFVNGTLAATSKDTFASLEVDVKDLLRDGLNELVVRVTSGMELAPDSSGKKFLTGQRPPLYAVRSFVYPRHRFLRKPAYNAYGWDWCDPLPNIGIWRGVRLEGRTDVVIHHLRVDTRIRNCVVTLEGEVILENLEPRSEIPCVLELLLEPPYGRAIAQRLDMGAQIGRFAVPCRIEVPDPKLWWPNGMGRQSLYRLTARVLCGGRETDRLTQTIGLRTIELVRQSLPQGSRFELRVNEQPLYCKGGNWAPADLIPARIDAARYQRFIELARTAGFTMLRVNGVGLYESDAFYEACDRAGILVWQDFTFSVAEYPDQDPEFLALVRNEATSVVRRLRHHASLALWCGNNECTWLMGGSAIYSELLPDICRVYDPVRAYWPGSPFGGIEPNSETSGDYHWWGKGGPGESADLRYGQSAADACRARFVSEFGALGPPVLASIRQYLKADELSPESVTWQIHTNMSDTSVHGSAIKAQIRYHYGSPDGLTVPQYLIYGQMCQAIFHGRVVEALRFRKQDPNNDCQGALVWSYNDTWGEIGWSIVDHYGRRKPSYYWFRRAAAPVKVLVRSRHGYLVTRVVNDTLEHYGATVRCGWMRLDGSSSELEDHVVAIPSNGTVEVAKVPVPGASERDPSKWLYAATLRGLGIADDQSIWLLAPHRELAFSRPAFSREVRGGVLKLRASVYCHGVHVDDEGAGVLADNYLDLLPGVSYDVGITRPMQSRRYELTAVLPIGVHL